MAEPGNPTTCAICMSPIAEGDAMTNCPTCVAPYHTDCWQENGGCAIYGCSQAPEVEARKSIEIPVSYWGQEKKPCPACGKEIQAAALRCRFCGTTFASARPQGQTEFQQQSARDQKLPTVQRTVLWIFILSVLPCLSPVGVIWGLIWNANHRDEINALPSIYPALSKIGLIVGIVETVMMILTSILFSLSHA